jgi:hypothetical protein
VILRQTGCPDWLETGICGAGYVGLATLCSVVDSPFKSPFLVRAEQFTRRFDIGNRERAQGYGACRSLAWQRSARSTSSRPSRSSRRSAAGGSVAAMYSSVTRTVSSEIVLTV